jgi:hypothetical protein
MERFNRGAELALLGTVVTVAAAWSYHVQVTSKHTDAAENATTTAEAVHVAESAGAGGAEPDKVQEESHAQIPQSAGDPTQAAADNEAFHKERAARGKLLKDLHAQLATLSDARDDGWSAIFAPLPSSETQQQKETAKRTIVARIRQVEAM